MLSRKEALSIRTEARTSLRSARTLETYQFYFDIKNPDKKLVLDVGSGDAELAGLANRIIRIDPAYELWRPQNPHDAVTAIGHFLPFRSEVFDEVFASFCLYHVRTALTEVLCEMHRVTKIGGKIKIFPSSPKLENLVEFPPCTQLILVSGPDAPWPSYRLEITRKRNKPQAVRQIMEKAVSEFNFA